MTVARTKSEFRSKSLAQRRALPLEESQQQSEATCRELFAWLKKADRHRVAGYASLADEISTRPLLDALWNANLSVALPRVTKENSPHPDGILELWLIRGAQELDPGHFGILEPSVEVRAQNSRRVAPENLDAIVVPGAAFDRAGGRIGFGRGHYDRLLERTPAATPLIGLCFGCQVFERLPQEPHDVRMTHLAVLGDVVRCSTETT